ncbi:Sec-independent protein translocase protein TatB [Sphingomonas sp. IC081]|uniref:Sec-independent protein translocase protein TatB n=1 Tax=Sphingomonas sp. IC081 TaxID=304378 RepID=UPI00115BC430|nr:Sec-independent protein translocase protein TatB [Sphingomonas sp. IC081]QDK33693.1 twin-arginine translocase subunit TatB [Sphingomonas sp. IC081]
MFDVGASELLLIVIVAVVVIGPKDMPLAMRTAGRWIGKMRKISGHFRAGIDAMVREAELEEMERKWREQNEAIMKANPVLPTAEEMLPPPSPMTPAEIPAGDKPLADTAASAPAPETAPAPVATTKAEQAEFHLPPPPP